MIFTTLNSDLSGITNKFAILNTNVSDLMNAFSAGYSGNKGMTGFVSGLQSMRNAMSNSLTKSDIANIQAYNDAIDACVSPQTAWYRTMQNSSKAAKDLVANANGNKVAMEGLAVSANKSKIAMLGLRAASIALNVALSMGIAYAISAVVNGLDNLIHAQENASQEADELAQKSKEQAQTQLEEVATLTELIEKYRELANSDTQDITTRNSIRDVQSQITDLVGDQAANLNLVNGELDKELDTLKKIQQSKAEDTINSAIAAYHDALDAAEKATGNSDPSFAHPSIGGGWDYVGDRDKKAEEILYALDKANQLYITTGGWADNTLYASAAVVGAEAKVEKLTEWINALKNAEDYDHTSSDFYTTLVKQRNAYQDYVDAQIEAANGLLEAVTIFKTYDSELTGITVNSAETYEQYRQALIESIMNSPDMAEVFESGILTTEDITNQDAVTNYVDTYMATLDSFSKYYNDWKKEFQDLSSENGVFTDEQKENVINSFKNNSISDWFDSLPDEDKELVYQIGVKSDDTTIYTLTRWRYELDTMKQAIADSSSELKSFDDIINDTTDGNLSEYIEGYTKRISTLQDALSKVDTGTLEESDKISLATEFKDLAPYINDTDALSDAIQNLIDTSNQSMNYKLLAMIEELAETSPESAAALEALRVALDNLSTGSWDFNLDDEITKFDNLYSAMKESVSATGLSSKAMENVKSMFSGLDGYDPSKLFERTYNGIHMNTRELRNLQAEYEKQKKSEIDSHLKDLIADYNKLSKELATCTDSNERASKITQLENLQKDITAVSDLASQYAGLTSAYNKWIQAQSAGEEGELYDQIRDGAEGAKTLYDEGRVGTNAFRTYVDLLSGQDLSTATVDEVVAAYEKLGQTIQGTSYTAMDFLDEGSTGCENFLNAVNQLNSDWAKMNDDGWEINFGRGDDQKIADALGLDVEYVQSILRKLSEYNFDINLDSIFSDMDNLGVYAEQASEKLKELGKTDIDFNFNSASIDEVNSQITEAQTLLDTFKNTDGTVNTTIEGATEAEAVLIALITRKQELSAPSVMNVDTTNADSNITTTIGLLKDFQTNYNDIEIETAVGADTTQAQTNIQTVLGQIESMPDEVKTSLGLDDTNFQTALTTLTSTNVDVKAGVNLDATALETVKATISGISPEMMVKAGLDASLIDGYVPPDKTNEVKYTVNDSDVQKYSAPRKTGTVQYNAYMNSWSAPTKYGTVIYTVKTQGKAPSNGTANSFGIGLSSGTAFAQGSWGAKKSGTALGGEVAPELVVRDGKFFTIGDDGAEFFNYKKDDIIFNAGQTAQIFKYGKIKNGKKRGEVFAQGTAFAEGTAFSNGSGSFTSGGSGSKKNSSSKGSSSSGKSSGGKSSSKSDKDFKETFDWIEVAIDRIERAISKLDTKASSVYRAWSERNKNLTNEMSKVSEEIKLQQAGYTRYMQQANSVGLSTEWMNKVKNGLIDINTITDEGLADKIKEAQEWVDKAKDCEDAVVELQEKLSELYQTAFDNVAAQYDGILGVIKHEQSMIEEYISQAENKGYLVSVKYYEALMAQEKQNISQLQKEKADQLQKMTEAVSSGAIARGSEAWYAKMPSYLVTGGSFLFNCWN